MSFYDDGVTSGVKRTEQTKINSLLLARVVKVYPLDMCVDVVYLDTYDVSGTTSFDSAGKGQLGIKVPVLTPLAGAVPTENWFSESTEYGKHLKSPLFGYGISMLPNVGDYVVVGFLRGNYSSPVVLGCLHPLFRALNISGASEDPEDEQGPTENYVLAEKERYIAVFPSGVWFKVNHLGEIEASFPLGKNSSELGGFFIKIGREDPVSDAKGLIDSVVKAKEKAEEMKEAAQILDLDTVKDIVNQVQSGELTMEEAVDKVLADKQVQKILSGDPDTEEDYNDGGCCCGAIDISPEDPASSCVCGAGWATCPNCGSPVDGCPYKDTWTCSNCGTVVDNPNR
jgi:hypothetical protein